MQLKTIQDYYEELYRLYPNIPKGDIKRAVLYGWKSFYLHNNYGGDVLINQKGFWFYCGRLMNDSIQYFNYYKRKMIIKLRIMYRRKKVQWDGFYYFALTEEQYKQYLELKNKKGRPRKNFVFQKIILYKIYDECNISESNRVAIFKIPIGVDFGMTLYKEELITDKAELIQVRNPLKFKDILLSRYNYQLLLDKSKYNKNKKNGE